MGLKNAKIRGRHFTPDDFQRIFRLSFLAYLLGRSLSLKLFLHSSSLDHPP
ncbi:Hypothetical protein FKW44_010132 [Caligus rogercresseyi]|uniref:Uncharacterized protein n=1 Tax=Caligus rogercresseyi TaxID=217165 RepID=A0A7T8HG49_CALRO|nr:Hypothetical protein FKW44_010132 [Caligus rogercresseyi]